MPFLSCSHSTPVSSPKNDPVSIRPPSSSSNTSPGSTPEVWNYLWIPVLLSLNKDFVLSKASDLPSSSSLLSQNDIRDRLPESPFIPRCPTTNPELNDNPVIGILSHPGDGASGRLKNVTGVSYIAASYVKFIVSAGARVIPLIYNEPQEKLFEKLSLVNGLLFTGGKRKTGQYFDIVQALFNKARETNDNGVHFPLYAICLGFELLSMIISEDKQILDKFNCANQASTLQFVENADFEGTVFQRFSPELLNKLQTDCLAMQVHSYGITPSRFQENKKLSNFFRVLTTSKDLNDKEYVSTVQAHNYPVTGFQWHPEKNAFEWGKSMIPHSEDAVQVTQHVANFFISEARKSLNRPPLQKVLDNLIYNYSPTYCGKAGYGYDEVYIFEQKIISKV